MSLLTNLTSYWKLDESSGNAADSVGSVTLTNTNTVGYAAALVNNGADFGTANTNKYLLNTTNAGIDGGAVSISCWVKVRTEIAAGTWFFVWQASATSQVAYDIRYDFNAGSRRVGFERTKIGSGAAQTVNSTITLGTSTFHHLVLTYDGATVTGYIDGASVGTIASSGNGVSATTSQFSLGSDGGSFASAYMDETSLYSRALSAAEVLQIYNGGLGMSFTNLTTRYWVGGTGNWDASTKTHWAFTSAGTAGADVPTSADSVFFNGSSGGGTTTITATANCNDITCTGYAGTLAGSSDLNIYGSMTLVSGMTLSYTGAITFASIAAGKTITTGTKSIGSTLTFNGVGGGWTLQDALTCTVAATLTNGSLNLNNLNTSFLSFSSANANTRVLTMGSGTISLTGIGTVWDTSTITGLTLTPNTSTIKLTNTSSSTKTFSGGGKTFNNIWITGAGTGTYTIVGSNTFTDFKVDTPPHTVNFTAGTRQTVTTWNVTGTAGNLITLQSTVTGTQWTLASTNILASDYISLQDSKGLKL